MRARYSLYQWPSYWCTRDMYTIPLIISTWGDLMAQYRSGRGGLNLVLRGAFFAEEQKAKEREGKSGEGECTGFAC